MTITNLAKYFAFIFLALGIANTSHSNPLPTAQPESVGISSDRLQRITQAFENRIEAKSLPGVVIRIARRGKLVYSNAIGWQDIESNIPMAQDSIFRIYSMTKPIVSVAAMTLVESGLLSLSDPVSKYLPMFKDVQVGIETVNGDGITLLKTQNARTQITVQDLMRHTSGLTYGEFGKRTLVKEKYLAADLWEPHSSLNWTLEDYSNTLAGLPLAYEPGSTWEYGRSTDVLGRVIEVVSGTTLDRYLSTTIFIPLGMKDTSYGVPENKHNRVAENMIDTETGTKINLTDVKKPVTLFSGGSGLSSTADDYLRFCQMMLNGGELNGVRILSPKTVRFMSVNHINENISKGTLYLPGPGYGFGLGFAIRLENGQSAWPGSVGEYFWAGYGGTYFWIDPVEELVVSFMSQDPYRRNEHRVLLRNLVYQSIID
ncbi:MAG: serine hydrolase [Proteobacteria bacterium]|nr:serine hydrolase [Pseudomonadota bacterium]